MTPNDDGTILNSFPAPTNVTGVDATAANRRSSSFVASDGDSPPTAIPAIRVPSASLVGEPAKKSGTTTIGMPTTSARMPIRVQGRDHAEARRRETTGEEAATAAPS